MTSLIKSFIPIELFTIEQAINEIKEHTGVELTTANLLQIARKGELNLGFEVDEMTPSYMKICGDYFGCRYFIEPYSNTEIKNDLFIYLSDEEFEQFINQNTDYQISFDGENSSGWATIKINNDKEIEVSDFFYSGIVSITSDEIDPYGQKIILDFKSKRLPIEECFLEGREFSFVDFYFYSDIPLTEISLERIVVTLSSLSELIKGINQSREFYADRSEKTEFDLLAQLTALQAENDKLKIRINQSKQSIAQNKDTLDQTLTNQAYRISRPQRDLFALLVMNCYPDFKSRNALFDAINADLKEKGIKVSDINYPTLDKLIDEKLRINNKSPFPPKQK